MLEGLITKFLADKAIEAAVKKAIEMAGTHSVEDIRKFLLNHPDLQKYLSNPLIKKAILEFAPDEVKPMLKGFLGSDLMKDLDKLSPDDLKKKLDDKNFWEKLKAFGKEALNFAFGILPDKNTTDFLIPTILGLGTVVTNPQKSKINEYEAVKSVGASSTSKFRRVAQSKFVKVAQEQDSMIPNFSLDPNFKEKALQDYQKIMSSNASDRDKAILMYNLQNNLESQVGPVLEYIKQYMPDIYSQYEARFK